MGEPSAFQSAVTSVSDQFATVINAPVPFLLVVAVLAVAIWQLVKREFATRLANADSTIAMLEKRLDRQEVELSAENQPTNIPPPAELAPRDTSKKGLDTGESRLKEFDANYRSYTKLQASQEMKKFYGERLTLTGTITYPSLRAVAGMHKRPAATTVQLCDSGLHSWAVPFPTDSGIRAANNPVKSGYLAVDNPLVNGADTRQSHRKGGRAT